MAGPEEAQGNVSRDSQVSKIAAGSKGNYNCFMLMAFSNLVALTFKKHSQESILTFQKEVRLIGQES